jgi:hypothetical protein
MLRRLQEFLGAHAAKYERMAHQEAFTALEEPRPPMSRAGRGRKW